MQFQEVDDIVDDFAWGGDINQGKKLVILLRGFPGCGKSTFASQVVAREDVWYLVTGICSADDYFVHEDGSYYFQPHLLYDAHERCQAKFCHFLGVTHVTHVIVVDNSNLAEWEMQFYINHANAGGHIVKIVSFECTSEDELHALHARNVHGVDFGIMRSKYRRGMFQPSGIIVRSLWY